jgi:broad specificity phosphatase PhoE
MATKIMLIRHAEKPSDDGSVAGVSVAGQQDPEALVVRGWQRAGALARFFAPVHGAFTDPRLGTPDVIFASAVAKHSNSLRPQQTVLELASVLKLKLDLRFAKGDEAGLVEGATAANGRVLIAWEHEAIPDIANRILGTSSICPQKWPGSRFDVVWIFDRQGNGWSFAQVPQLLLSGDSPHPI